MSATFESGEFGADRPAPADVSAVVVFAIQDGCFLVARIPGRGWCAPSGRLETGESPLDAALRETREETGAELADVRELGRYILSEPSMPPSYVPAFVGRVAAVHAIPSGSESLGVRCARMGELPDIYWMWDELLAAMFAYAAAVAGA